MFSTYNKDFADKLARVDEAYEVLKKELSELHDGFHSLNESEADKADLTAFDYQVCDMTDWRTDNLVPLIIDHEKLRFNDNEVRPYLSQSQMGLKTGRAS